MIFKYNIPPSWWNVVYARVMLGAPRGSEVKINYPIDVLSGSRTGLG